MRTIHKNHEPQSLRLHRLAGGSYADYNKLDELRATLLDEQGYICCYCMTGIGATTMQVEHWVAQSVEPSKALEYKNLLATCLGGKGEPSGKHHCDRSRGNIKLTVNPVDRSQRLESLISYRPNGEIASDHEEIRQDLVRTLNLNVDALQRARKKVIDAVRSKLAQVSQGPWTTDMYEEELARWQRRDRDGHYREYCQVVIYYLKKKLKKA